MTLIIFIFLQVADILSTLACMHYGGYEGNPIARWILAKAPTPIIGMIWLKVMATIQAAIIFNFRKIHLLVIVNWFFGLVVLWNLLLLIWVAR
jgi:hypothetical protein